MKGLYPGGLAVIVKCGIPDNLGKTVELVRRTADTLIEFHDGQRTVFTENPDRQVAWVVSGDLKLPDLFGFICDVKQAPILEKNLVPLDGYEPEKQDIEVIEGLKTIGEKNV